jgi:hypothetical protein
VPLLEDHSASFIVRVWRELGEGEQPSQEWRGSIEHVGSGERVFFRNLRSIATFMQPHLEKLGIEAPLRFWDEMTPDLLDGGADVVKHAHGDDSPVTPKS